MKEETIERTSASGSNKEATITRVKRERNLRLKEWNPAEDDPWTIKPTLRSTLTIASIHAPNQKPTLWPTTPSIHVDPWSENKEQRTENREQRETIRPHQTHDYRTTIAEPETSSNQNHRRITSIGREKRERKEERTEFGERVVRIKNFFYSNRESNGSGKNEEKEV